MLKKTILLLLLISSITSCDFIGNMLTYKDTTEQFVNSLLQEDYDKSLTFMATERDDFKNTNIDTLKNGLTKFKKVIVTNFGNNLEYEFLTANKTFSTVEGESTEANTTKAQIEFKNDKEFGIFEIVFDDSSNKIININMLDFKEQIPNMLYFWLFGIFPVAVLIFNIYVIRLIKKSNLSKKWLKYVGVLFFNVPSITYSLLYGLSLSLLSFQFILGFSFNYSGYSNSFWTVGIPLGGIYWLWKLSKIKNEEVNTVKEDFEFDV